MAKYIIGNWKSYKTVEQSLAWLEETVNSSWPAGQEEEKIAVVCPPFSALSEMKHYIDRNSLPLRVGAQNCSPYEEGAYTGEVTAGQLRELCDYVIIGHSERRKLFNETDEMLAEKVVRAHDAGLHVIFCVQGKETMIPDGVAIVAYEPVFAIGSGTPDTPDNAEEVARFLKQEKQAKVVLYGGSVKPENIATFTNQSSIDGALIGGASLSADSFLSLVKNA